jgi:hypothetical protein
MITALISTSVFCLGYGRRVDRDWDIDTVTANASVVTITADQSGSLWLQPVGSDITVKFSGTASATEGIYITDKGSMDFWPANITIDDTISIYGVGTVTINYTILD